MKENRNSRVYLAKGIAWTQGQKGRRENVEYIEVPTQDSCCKLDCCKQAIVFKDKDSGELKEISLQALYDLINT